MNNVDNNADDEELSISDDDEFERKNNNCKYFKLFLEN
jgi:hypothetical protein